MTCMTSHVYDSLRFASPVAKVRTSHSDASSKTPRASRTEATPLGSFCQKAQLASRRAEVLYCSLSTGFLCDRKRRRRESGNQVPGEGLVHQILGASICQRCAARRPKTFKLFEHGGTRTRPPPWRR
jgi:hypothetical protein